MNYVYYRQYFNIELATRTKIMRKLGVSSGKMREYAKMCNPKCVVVFDGKEPVGWVTLLDPIDSINVFVSKKYRNQGIGRELIRLITEKEEVDRKLFVYPFNQKGEKFFKHFDNLIIVVEGIDTEDEEDYN